MSDEPIRTAARFVANDSEYEADVATIRKAITVGWAKGTFTRRDALSALDRIEAALASPEART